MGGRNLSLFLFLKSALKVARPCAFHFFMFTVVLWLWHSKIEPQGAKRAKREEWDRYRGRWGRTLLRLFTSCGDYLSNWYLQIAKKKRKAAATTTTTHDICWSGKYSRLIKIKEIFPKSDNMRRSICSVAVTVSVFKWRSITGFYDPTFGFYELFMSIFMGIAFESHVNCPNKSKAQKLHMQYVIYGLSSV